LDSGVVDQDFEPAEMADDFAEHAVDVGGAADMASDGDRLAAEGF
jgi:hypothetical protein